LGFVSLDEYILFSKNEEGSFEIKIPFSADSLNQVSELLSKEGVLVQKDEMEQLQTELSELKSLVSDLRKENGDLSSLLKDLLKEMKEEESKKKPTPATTVPAQKKREELKVPEDKISMLPSPKSKAFKLISRLAKEHMDSEFTTSSLTLYEKRVFSLLVKRYEFVKAVKKEGRSIVYEFNNPALEAICKELGGSTSVSVRSRVRSKRLEEYLEKTKGRYPHFTYQSIPSNSAYKQYRLLFSDKSVKKSVIGNITRTFGPSSVKVS
jgi:hypothetical protein